MSLQPNARERMDRSGEERERLAGDGVVVELPLGDAVVATFDLEKAVCSHGLFMMAPNRWDPHTKTLQRPLRPNLDDDSDVPAASLLVRVSHPSDTPHSLRLRVSGVESLSPKQQQSLMAQVRRMLRLSQSEERIVREFQQIHWGSKERGFGRVFRSPTLFEDMVKCILLCNCNWPRTLSMARALCELQFELQCLSVSAANESTNSSSPTAKTERFIPKTPGGRESKRELRVDKNSPDLESRFVESNAEMEAEDYARMDCVEMPECTEGMEKLSTRLPMFNEEEDLHISSNYSHASAETYKAGSCLLSEHGMIGNFPSPRELACLDEEFLAKRCNLGYRASYILKLARGVVEGRILLRQLEEACCTPSSSTYDELSEQLKQFSGFGPFTCANVLMCMGFYHVIPTDTETIRHLKQVHGRRSTIRTVQRIVDAIYGKYAPFQFLAYWSEIWQFYEDKFGKLSEMAESDYKLMTAANMRPNKRIKRI